MFVCVEAKSVFKTREIAVGFREWPDMGQATTLGEEEGLRE